PRLVLARIARNFDLLVVVLVVLATIGFATVKIYNLWRIEQLQPQAIPASEIKEWGGADHRHAFYFQVPPAYRALSPDTMAASHSSSLFLAENGAILRERHEAHTDINGRGGGRYSHWGEYVVFSTSDNSDPRNNGRNYTIRGEQGRTNYV